MTQSKSKRARIRELLLQQIPELKNIYEPSMAKKGNVTPHAILRSVSEGKENEYRGYDEQWELWLHTDKGSFAQVDKLADKVKHNALPTIFRVDDTPYYLNYLSITEDVYLEDWEYLAKCVRFECIALDWLLHNEVAPDPIEAVNYYTSHNHPNVQVNPTTWLPTDDSPAVYWRQQSVTKTVPTTWGAWVTAELKAHVVTLDAAKRKEICELIMRDMVLLNRLYLSDKSPARILDCVVNDGYNPFTEGQVTMTVEYGILKRSHSDPLKHAKIKDVDNLVGVADVQGGE